MRRILAALLVSIFSFSFFTPPARAQTLPAEYIRYFESTVTIQKNTNLRIEEKILFHTDTPRHGIYRSIPYRYTRGGINHSAEISDIEIENENGTTYQFEKSRQDGMLTLRIGDPDKTFTGDRSYVIRYEVEKALQQHESSDELYWDITGEGWQFPILSASTHVISADAHIGQLRCFTGSYGSQVSDCSFTQNGNSARFHTTSSVQPNENFTIVVELTRPNQLQFPSAEERLLASLWDNWWVPVLLLPSVLLFSLWMKRGRDWMFLSPNVFADDKTAPQQRKPLLHRFRIPMVYEPIQDLTPAEVGAIENERLESREIAAEIVDLARKKFLKITATEKTGLLGTSLRKSTAYSLEKQEPKGAKSLPAHQAFLLKKLFATKKVVKIADLKGKFSAHWQKFQEMVWDSVTEKSYFAAHPKKTQGIYVAVAITALVLAFILASVVVERRVDSFIPFLLVGVQVPICLLFAVSMPRKTALGVNVFLQARGLKETIQRGAWREKIKEKNLFIEEVLPFAVAFGVVDTLARHMEQLGSKPPDYISGAALSSASFQNFTNDFTSSVSTDLSYNPSSSHSSSGSGFSSGGGFSGGGGGGGGGGSW